LGALWEEEFKLQSFRDEFHEAGVHHMKSSEDFNKCAYIALK